MTNDQDYYENNQGNNLEKCNRSINTNQNSFFLMNNEFLLDKKSSIFSQIKDLPNNKLQKEIHLYLNTNPTSTTMFIESLVATSNKMNSTWNEIYDLQGKSIIDHPKIMIEDFELFWEKVNLLAELIRPRLSIEISDPKIAVGTLLNVHHVSQLVDLQIREKTKILTYYWGIELNIEKIKKKIVSTPIDILVLSVMGVNSELNAFEELLKIRSEFPNLIIIVGGSAWPLFDILKAQPFHPALTLPYKQNSEYLREIQSSSSLEQFVRDFFKVEYCADITGLIEFIQNIPRTLEGN